MQHQSLEEAVEGIVVDLEVCPQPDCTVDPFWMSAQESLR
jgi:hypothetical protein